MNVLAICAGYIPSVILCGDIQLNKLASESKLNYRFKLNHAVTADDLVWLDILYIIRGDSSYCVSLAKWCKKHKKNVIYVLDDNLLEIPSNLSASEFYMKNSTQKAIKSLIELSNGFVSPSINLIDKYATSNHKVLQIIEPAVNILLKKEINKKIKIGFAGSIDHGNDIDNMLYDVFKELKKKYSDKIEIELFGPTSEKCERLGIKMIPFLNSYEEYQEQMKKCNWDIGLAPLQDLYFNSFKHYNKLVEYETYGIVGVYSNVYPFKFAVENMVNGLSVDNNTESWVDAISSLIENEELRKTIQTTCLNEAENKYSLRISTYNLYEYLNTFSIHKNSKCLLIGLPFQKIWWKIKYICIKIISKGIKLLKKI